MHLSTALAAAAAIMPIVNAHGDAPAMPKIFGLNIRDLKTRNMFNNLKARSSHFEKRGETLKSRQNTGGQCGGSFGSCAAGVCCSGSGWCGTGPDYCYAPGCNYQFGPGCPDNAVPAGSDTANVPRPKLGSIPYGGTGVYSCANPGTVAITYDDGPFKGYTEHILEVFKRYNAKATFFITGNNINKGQIDLTEEHRSVITRAHTEGHQIASHTWTHQDLSAISSTDRKLQMTRNEMALRNILGFFPTYMRPPYSSCTAASGCEQDLADLGYHITYFDVDTDDYNQDAPGEIQNSKNWFQGNITAGGASSGTHDWLSISHDIHEQTATNLTEFMLSTITTLGYRAVTVGECLNDPKENWYRTDTGGGQGSISSTTVS
ncbi:carbohydrate esterase family 4 protein [Aaosphaeria arxii CBS 175.79]|uniref:Carbohydrate esterase family 4 protein n=1 Tax=Aaosphaeria arxii CBS 175.79 TaxID=1450172 RepID=A0A6A5Y331_9PLEO|nr:carbohydrate esterase family 4 protein [Aaosphaeria arxii CBS 175.79]KAF2019643.1 carbohydrate esterase family 4 protein [Aaosphaeria arxii CBS 175.79]